VAKLRVRVLSVVEKDCERIEPQPSL
jgi:hypothetical protein